MVLPLSEHVASRSGRFLSLLESGVKYPRYPFRFSCVATRDSISSALCGESHAAKPIDLYLRLFSIQIKSQSSGFHHGQLRSTRTLARSYRRLWPKAENLVHTFHCRFLGRLVANAVIRPRNRRAAMSQNPINDTVAVAQVAKDAGEAASQIVKNQPLLGTVLPTFDPCPLHKLAEGVLDRLPNAARSKRREHGTIGKLRMLTE